MTTFPNNPTLNQEFTNNGILFIFNGTGWVPKTLSINPSESGGHIISNETEVFQPKPELQFIGNVEVYNEENKTVVNIPNFDNRYIKRTTENLPTLKEYPILYNSYAALDPRGIAPIGFHIPTSTELQTLVNFLGSATAGGKLKTEGLEYWDAPNTGATNSYGFSSKANGIRGGVDGTYSQFRWFHNILSSTPVPGHSDMYYQTQIAFNNSFMGIAGVSGSNKAGMSLRCIKNNNTPSIGDIVDGSGNKYTEVTIGTQIWLSQDLKTTKYINGDTIPNVTSPTTWVTLSTGALCYYNNLMFPANKRVVQTASGNIALIDETSSASGNTEVTVDNAAAYDDATIYNKAGTVVSFSNPASSDPQFQTPKLYQLAVALVVAGTDPEESPYDTELLTGNWQYMGETIQAVNDNTSKIYINGANPLGQLKSITGYKHGDNVVLQEYNSILFFNQNAVVGASYNPATNTYVEVFVPYDWTEPKGGWVEQCSTDRQRKFYTDAADIRHNARNYPVGGDIVDLSTGNVLRLTQTGAPFTDDGAATIIPTYKLFDVPCAFVKVGELGGGHTIKDVNTTLTQRVGLKFIGNVAVTDDSGGDNTVVEILETASNVEDLGVNTPAKTKKLLKINTAGDGVDFTDYGFDEVLQTSAIDYSQPAWMVGESRLLLTTKLSSTEGNFEGAAELMDLILPPAVLATLEGSDANWTNETKTVTGDNSTYALGRTGQFGWLSDRTFVQCTSASYAVSGSATFNRNRAVDALNIADTQDLAVINLLEPSRTGGTDNDGWNLTTQTKVITTVPCKVGTYWVGGTNGEGNWFTCFAQSGTSYYWKRLGTPASVQRPITTASHPTLTGRLLAKADWGTSLYTVQAGDETSYQDQTFWDTATRAYFIKVTATQWEKIK